MFRQIAVTVTQDDGLVFSFPVPVSIESLLVCDARDAVLWEFIADELQPVETAGGSFQSWPIDQAPPELLALVARMQEQHDRELLEHGPRKPPLSQVVYGVVPAGFRQKVPPASLQPGEYSVLVVAEQGQGGGRFSVA